MKKYLEIDGDLVDRIVVSDLTESLKSSIEADDEELVDALYKVLRFYTNYEDYRKIVGSLNV